MKSRHLLSVAAGVAAILTLATGPAAAASGQPVPGKEGVTAVLEIDNTPGGWKTSYEQRSPAPTTPFVLTRGTSNAVHGMPSNPVFGGNIAFWNLNSSNALVPANTPFDLLNRADAQAWDKTSFAYSMGDGPSFAIGVAAMEWKKRATASYAYAFEHINQTAQPEVLAPISLHIDPGMLFLVPTFFGGGDNWSTYTDVQVSFTHHFQASIAEPTLGGTGWMNTAIKGQGDSAANFHLDGIRTTSDGAHAISFPTGYFDRVGSIATQVIPEQTLAVPQFDLLPGQRLSISLSMQVSAYVDGLGTAPILYAVAGDPLALTGGRATPNISVQFAPAPVPEPAAAAMLLAGLGLIGLRRRPQRAANSSGCESVGPAPKST